MNKKIKITRNLWIMGVAMLAIIHSCDKNKMEWGRDPMYGEITVAELPLELREAISRYEPLKNYAPFSIGAGIDFHLYTNDAVYRDLVITNFHEVTPANELKHRFMVNASGQLNFGPVDAVVDQLTQAGLKIYGHTLVWHENQNASYLNSLLAPTIVPGAGGSILDVSALVSGSFTGWNRNNADGITVMEGGGLSSGPALRFEVSSSGNEWDTQLTSPGIPATEGHEYEISFWIKSDATGNGRMSFANMSNNYPWLDGAALFATSGSWTRITYSTSTLGSAFTATDNSIRIAFDLGKTAGIYYVDINSISVVDKDAAPAEYNYVNNGGFETGNLTGWSALNAGADIEVTGEQKYEGNYSVKMVSSASSNNAWDLQLESADITLEEGKDYTFSFQVRSNAAGRGRVSFPGLTDQYPWMDWQGSGASEAFTTGTDWSLISVDLDALAYPSGSTSMRLSFDFGYLPDVTYYVDDVKIVQKGGNGGSGGTVIIEKTPAEKTQIIGDALETWITGVVGHYRGKIYAWDVINEAMAESGVLRTGTNVTDPASDEFYWQDYLGQDYAVTAFNLARQADPDAKLFINDYNLESGSLAKLDGLITYVQYIESQGAQVDGIGTQMHVSLNSDKDNIARMFEKLAATGKLIKVTELDVQVGTTAPTVEQYAEQAAMYRYIVDMYKQYIPQSQQYGITVWGISDHEREHEYWLPDDAPNLWDPNYQRKHAYKGFADGLAGRDVSEEFSGELQY